jgi:hypothetical protein
MRQLPSVAGPTVGILVALAGCSGKDGSPDGVVADAAAAVDGPARSDGGDGASTVAADDGGLGANLSWYCPAQGASCPQSEIEAYNRCLLDRCEGTLRLCPCDSWIACTTRCACSDLACRAACIPTFDCLSCGQSVAQCVKGSGCTRPACYEAPDASTPDVVRPPVIPPVVTFPTPPVRDAGADGATDGLPAPDGGLVGTCADLRRCCDSLATPDARTMCQSQVMMLQTDSLCAAALLVYRGNGQCQ